MNSCSRSIKPYPCCRTYTNFVQIIYPFTLATAYLNMPEAIIPFHLNSRSFVLSFFVFMIIVRLSSIGLSALSRWWKRAPRLGQTISIYKTALYLSSIRNTNGFSVGTSRNRPSDEEMGTELQS